jgi:hypothetical protein
VLEAFEAEASGQWILAYGRWQTDAPGLSGGQYSCFLSAARARKAVMHPGWDLQYDSSRPGFSQSFSGGRRRTRYERPGADGVEALVHVRFIPDRPTQFEISEEFKHLFELFSLPGERSLFMLDESGNDVEAVRLADTEIHVQTQLIRRYQAARQLHLALFIDSTVIGAEYLRNVTDPNWQRRDATTFLTYNVGDLGPGSDEKPFSRLLGKRILPPPPRKDSGIWPFGLPRRSESFIIAVDDVGRPIEYSANPNGLASNSGPNADAPSYVTSVYFRRAVLGKYYDHPERYSVEDGYLRCGGLWGMRMDNDHSDYVIAMLGDLGRDLPFSEQSHWKSHNISPAGPMSETAFRRGFLGQPMSARALDLRFKREYKETNRTWQQSFGWPLFVAAGAGDAHVLSQLHVPLEDGQYEFDQQVLNLAKLLVDLLNDRAVAAIVGPGPKEERSLGRLRRFLLLRGAASGDSIMATLRAIQDIRSTGAAHIKGSNYEKALGALPKDRRRAMESLLNAALLSLSSLREIARKGADRS